MAEATTDKTTAVAAVDRTAADRAAADRAAVDKTAGEKARANHAGAQEGATSVAEAVKRVADAAVAEIQKVKVGAKPELLAVGSPGGRVTIDSLQSGPGNGFGPSGTVTIGGQQVHTRDWSTQRIVGDCPAGVASGAEVVVHVDDKVARRGHLS